MSKPLATKPIYRAHSDSSITLPRAWLRLLPCTLLMYIRFVGIFNEQQIVIHCAATYKMSLFSLSLCPHGPSIGVDRCQLVLFFCDFPVSP